MRRRLRGPAHALAAIAAAGVVAGGTPSGPATADMQQSAVVSENPVNWTPHVLDGTVRAFAVVGTKVVVGGNFSEVRQANNSTRLTRNNIFAFDAATGKIDTAFVPKVDSTVYALAPGTDGTVYAGGSFKNVNGSANRGLARLRLSNGTRVGTFTKAVIDFGSVQQMVRRGSRLYLGGTFTKVAGVSRTGLARLNASTGAVDSTFKFTLSDPRAGVLKVVGMAVNPADSRLVIAGTFTRVNGSTRYQIAMINTAASPASLTSWATSGYSDRCSRSTDTYMRDIDFSPDGSYFVVVTTGGPFGTTTLCDTAARWNTAETGSGQQPAWVNFTGGDTLLAVSATGAAVYVGGHQRWMDNPGGRDSAGPGAVSRPGIAALSPTTGKALAWNPTRTRGHGVEILLATTTGLLVGSDTEELGHEYHARVGMFPLV